MELPISFFLDYAWNPDNWTVDKMSNYSYIWAKQQFGEKYASEIADILDKYTKYNNRRKPELLSPNTYSLIDYQEAETIVLEYNLLLKRAKSIYQKLPNEYKDAFYQLVLFVLDCTKPIYAPITEIRVIITIIVNIKTVPFLYFASRILYLLLKLLISFSVLLLS